ncbi:F0F1 ATP synthase subunit gamma [Desulfovibrio sp. OttesenSCG-928-C06]|nr:F0F1 ATP synthase subunit gamma [Desulfovibrio sp. OttesenSCG-928-C06]
MASLKDVKMKISGVGKTKQITKAMNMVSSAKLRGAQSRIERFRPYADKFHEMLQDLASKTDSNVHPLLAARPEGKSVGIILVTSDRGLCGGFNVNLISAALKLANQKKAEGKSVKFLCIGRKGRDAIRKLGFDCDQDTTDGLGDFDFTSAARAGEKVIAAFLAEELDEAYLVYAEFVNMARQVPVTLGLLPMSTPKAGERGEAAADSGTTGTVDYIYEPDVGSLLAELLPRYLKVQVYRGLLDTSASEHAARMAAMDNATRNCDDIIKSLTLLYNKTRQATITTELIDIVSGADALK